MGAFGRFGGGGLVYAEPGSGSASLVSALLLTGSGLPVRNVLRAFAADSTAPVTGFPADSQGLDFLGSPTFVDVTGDGKPEMLEGGDSSALHAFGLNGAQAAGFPKFHTGWLVYSPSSGDLDSDGDTEVVALTREGYLMAWRTSGKASGNREWWSFRHDERNTARYGMDTRPPGVVRKARLSRGPRRLTFTAPGDDWYDGRAKRYLLTVYRRGRRPTKRTVAPSGDAGTRERIRLPRGTRKVRVQAEDDAGSLGTPKTVRVRRR
jgi:hypothetical protein